MTKVAIITGANKGIGKCCVDLLLAQGYKVFGLCRSGCETTHPNYTCIKCDVRNYDSVKESMQQIIDQENRVDVLINNAGLGYFAECEKLEIEQWHEMFDTNVNGLFYCTREVLPTMKSQGSGHIFNLASTAALEGYVQVSGYCATKFAVRGFSDALYKEVRPHGIKVTCVYPGSTKTDFFRHSETIKPHDNMMQPEDVAAQMMFALNTPPNFHVVNLEMRPLNVK